MRIINFVPIVLLAGSLTTLSGCSTSSVWENEFHRGDAIATPLPSGSQIRVRVVDWVRIQDTLTGINEKLAKSDKHYDDWSDSDKMRLKAQLLKGLQISEPVENVDLLGRSEFRTTDRIRPEDGTLEAFARKIGANTVIITSAYIGNTETIRQEAVTEYRTTTNTGRRDNGQDRGVSSEMSTMWVPLVVRSDENAYIAFFLRQR